MDNNTIITIAECIHDLRLEADAFRIKYHEESRRADELEKQLAFYTGKEATKDENPLETAR